MRNKVFIMENRIITGVGCFARLEKLNRVFLRMVQAYSLGKLDGNEWGSCFESGQTEGAQLLEALISGKVEGQNTSLPAAGGRHATKKITGFFLTLRERSLELMIFAQNAHCGRERHAAVLDTLTALRRRRLN